MTPHHLQHPIQGSFHDHFQVKRCAGHGCHVVQRREFLRPCCDSRLQYLFGLHLLGDVAHDAQDVSFAPVEEGCAVHFDVERGTILAQVDGPALECFPCLDRLQVLLKKGMVIGVDECGRMQAQEFLSRVAVHPTEGGIHLNDGAIQFVDDQAVKGRLKDAAILGFLLGQARLGLLALGNILDLRDQVEELTLRVTDHCRTQKRPDHLPILAYVPLLEPAIVPPAGKQILKQLDPHFQVVRKGEFLESLGDQLLGRIAEHLASGLVHLQETAIWAHQNHAERRVLESTSEGLFCSAGLGYLSLFSGTMDALSHSGFSRHDPFRYQKSHRGQRITGEQRPHYTMPRPRMTMNSDPSKKKKRSEIRRVSLQPFQLAWPAW